MFEVTPPIERTTGTASPVGSVGRHQHIHLVFADGPGRKARPLHLLRARSPIVTVGFVVVAASGSLGAAAPVGG